MRIKIPALPFRRAALLFASAVLLLLGVSVAFGHGVAEGDARFLEANPGRAMAAFAYLGAKHMFTGYDHILYLAGVIFFLYRTRDIAVYVTLFAAGHSVTLLAGVLADIHVNVYLVDAIIGLSVVYKAFENLGGFRKWLGWQPKPRAAGFCFGLAHGFGLATKLQALTISETGLVANMISFNIGVEIGQLLALAILLILINAWRATGGFTRHSTGFNVTLMLAGFLLADYQLAGYFFGP